MSPTPTSRQRIGIGSVRNFPETRFAINTLTPPNRWQTFWQYPITKIVLYALILFAMMLPGVILLGVLFALKKLPAGVILFWSEWLQAIASIGALWVMARFVDRLPFASFGLGGRGTALRETLAGFMIGAGMMSAVVAVMVLGGWCHLGTLSHAPSVLAGFRVSLGLCFAIGFSEEVIFRGYLFQTVERRWGTGIALLVTMLIFGLLHLMNPIQGATFGQKLVGALAISVEAGILLAAGYLLTRRLWLPIGLHWAWNLFQGSVYGARVSGEDFGTPLMASHFSGPFWATGGPFGPEASVPALVIGTVVGLILLRIAVRNGQWKQPSVKAEMVAIPASDPGAWPPAPKEQ